MARKLNNATGSRRGMGYAAIWLMGGLLAAAAVWQYLPAALANPRAAVTTEALEAGVRLFPGASELHARLAARLIDGDGAADETHEQIATRAYEHAAAAAKAAPANFEYRVLLAVAAEQLGDMRSAESALRAAVVLAPGNAQVNWLLGNFLLRAGKAEEALKPFQTVTAADAGRLPAALDLVWQAVGETPEEKAKAAFEVTPPMLRPRLTLASFLLRQERPAEAVAALDSVDRATLLTIGESGQMIDRLLGQGHYDLAWSFWRRLAVEPGETPAPGLWNGGFEAPLRTGLTQFDWTLAQPNKFARIAPVQGAGRTGERALQIAYQGVATTRFDEEIRQLVRVVPGGRYRLEGFVKAQAFAGPDPGPQVTITALGTKAVLGAASPVPAGTYDWLPFYVEFDAPADARAVLVSIKQTPTLSYADPTTGTLWFDDFVLTTRN